MLYSQALPSFQNNRSRAPSLWDSLLVWEMDPLVGRLLRRFQVFWKRDFAFVAWLLVVQHRIFEQALGNEHNNGTLGKHRPTGGF